MTGPRLVPLSGFEQPISVGEQIALTDSRIRQHVSYVIAGTFVLANILTLFGIAYVFRVDNANIAGHVIDAGGRVITPNVIVALVSGTTVQLGALALTMGRYLYPAAPGLAPPERLEGLR